MMHASIYMCVYIYKGASACLTIKARDMTKKMFYLKTKKEMKQRPLNPDFNFPCVIG